MNEDRRISGVQNEGLSVRTPKCEIKVFGHVARGELCDWQQF